MKTLTLVTSLLLAGLASQAGAQTATRPQAPAAPAEAEAAAPRGTPEPQVLNQVTEDEEVRIEELRVRGQSRRITVQPKKSELPAYEIAVPEPGRAPERDPKAGQRIWFSLTF